MHYFLAQDIEALERKIQETVEKLKEVGEELRTVMTQSSETWHDNFGFENAQQQARMLEQRLDDLEHIRRNAKIIEPPSHIDTVAIGHTVIVKEVQTEKCKIFRIGSHMAFTEETISYASPFGSLLLGKKVGERIKRTPDTTTPEYEIIEIL